MCYSPWSPVRGASWAPHSTLCNTIKREVRLCLRIPAHMRSCRFHKHLTTCLIYMPNNIITQQPA